MTHRNSKRLIILLIILMNAGTVAGYFAGVAAERKRQQPCANLAYPVRYAPATAPPSLGPNEILDDQIEEYGILSDRPYASSLGKIPASILRPTAGVEVRKHGNAFIVDNVGKVAVRVMCDEPPKYGPPIQPGEMLGVDPGDTPASCDTLWLEVLIPMNSLGGTP